MTQPMINQFKISTNKSILDSRHRQEVLNLSSADLPIQDEETVVTIDQVTAADIKCFFGIQLYQGLADLKEERMYFYKYLMHLEPPLKDFMGYSFYQFIKKHFTIPTNYSNDQWQHMSSSYNNHYSSKVGWYLGMINTLFTKYYQPGTNISIDESMGLFKGRCSFTKRMKNKPISEGHSQLNYIFNDRF